MNWSPETGYIGENIASNLDIISTDEFGKLYVDWSEIKKKAASANEGILPDILNPSFPLQPTDESMRLLFENKEAIFSAALHALIMEPVTFMVYTPKLYVLLQSAGGIDSVIEIIELATFYNLVIAGLSTKDTQTTRDAMEIYNVELESLCEIFTCNLLDSGMFNTYFTENRHPDAGKILCAETAKYSIALIQCLERCILRLSELGVLPGKTEQLCLISKLPELTDEFKAKLRINAKNAMISRKSLEEKLDSKSHPFGAEIPSPESTETTEFYSNVPLVYAETVLWYIQSQNNQPKP
jgi:hypothetical protein